MKKKSTKKTRLNKSRKAKKSRPRGGTRMASGDIIKLILTDHIQLKRLVKILKNDGKPLGERQRAFQEFAPLLISHAKPEEQTLYMALKDQEKLRSEGFEGDVEHTLADQMVEEAKRATDTDLWSAKVKVLAELVAHHLIEEEQDILPDFAKASESEERVSLGAKYRQLREELLAQGGEDALPEAKIRESQGEYQVHH
jgi:hypothetical protein